MKIIIFISLLLLLLRVQAQNFDEQSLTTIISSIETSSSSENLSFTTDFFDETSTTLDSSDIDSSSSREIEQQWFNLNNQSKKDSSKRFLSWIYLRNTSTYILQSPPSCLSQMCSVKLKYNGTISTRLQGCLAFNLEIRGQPVGQLWISEDNEQENISQKILFTGKTLRIEHSLKSKINNLSIDARILFRNPTIDRIFLSNLTVNWRGSCPKHRSKTTRSPPIIIDRSSTFDDYFQTSTIEDSTMFTDDEYDVDTDSSTTSRTRTISPSVRRISSSSSVLHENNFLRFLSFIASFCVLIISSSFVYGFWSVRKHSYSLWSAAIDSHIRFLFRRSLRSSNRSNPKIATIAQILDDLDRIDNQQQEQEQQEVNLSTDSDTPSSNASLPNVSYYTYL